jgi:hypothetical protein
MIIKYAIALTVVLVLAAFTAWAFLAPPRTYKTAFLADVILRYRGPVIATTTKADLFTLTSAVRSFFGPDMIRQLPAGFALVIRGGCPHVIARLPRAWRNPAYRRARRLHAEPPRELPPAARWSEPVIPRHLPGGPASGNFPWN